MDEYNINQRNKYTSVSDVIMLSSDSNESNDGNEDGTKSIEQNNDNILDNVYDKVTKDCNDSLKIYETDENIYHSDSFVEVNRKKYVFWKVFSDSEIYSIPARDKNQNHRLQHTKEDICNAREPCCEVGSNNSYENVNSIEKDSSSNQSLLYYLCIKLSNFLVRCNKKPLQRTNSDLEEQTFGNNHYLDRFFLEKSNRNTRHRFFANFKEKLKRMRPSRVKLKDYYYNNPLRRTYQVYFGELTTGGIEYDPDSLNWIVPVVLLTVLILLVMTAAYNLFWYQSAKLDNWASSTYDPAILCAFGCFVILFIDVTFSFVAVARHPVSSWICLIVVWACVQFITFYIGVKVRSEHTDNVLIVIVAPAVITSGVVLEFLWLSLLKERPPAMWSDDFLKMDLTRSILPHVISVISTLSLLAVMAGMTWGTLLYEIHELVICWILSLYYSVSMIVLLQMILTQKIYEINEYDVALPAMLLFLSPYSLITNLIRYFVFLARS